jgi:hypothetical protein
MPMHLSRPSAALLLLVSALLAGLLVGCGGGGDQSGSGGSQGGNEEQGGAAQGEGEQGGDGEQGGAAQGDPPEVKIALGRVIAVVPDRRKIILRPSAEIQGERMIFKVRDDAEISLNDQPAEMNAVREGQQAQIEYIVVNEQNRARRVELIAEGEGTG